MSLFVDSSVWFAVVNSRDRHNARAKSIISSGERLFTSNLIVAESWFSIRQRVHRAAAERFWDGLRQGVATVECVNAADFESAWTIGRDFPDQDFSLVDCTCFALMLRLGLTRVASFDDDFVIYRYGRDRARAFEIIR